MALRKHVLAQVGRLSWAVDRAARPRRVMNVERMVAGVW